MNNLKILNITDLHLTDKRYAGRKDDFQQTQLNKLNEIGRIIKKEKENVDKLIVLINGDLFNTPRIGQLFLIKIITAIKNWNTKVYIVPGNHDLYNDNISTLYKTHLGLLSIFQMVEILSKSNPIVFKIGEYKLGLQGKEYGIGIENKKDTYMYTGEEEVDFKMISVHGMLMDKEPPFDTFSLTKDVREKTNANIVTTGHYHPGFKDIIEENFAMFNPKSMIRTKRIKANLKRIPGGKIIEFTAGENKIDFSIKDFELKESFIPYEDAFKEGELEEFKATEKSYQDFKDKIADIGVKNLLTNEEILRLVAKERDLEEEIVNKALKLVSEMKEKTDENTSLEGYEVSKEKVLLKKLEIENFMCYTKEEIEFADGTTAFVGRSGNGKSTVLRAIKWLYYDEPSGSDFIQTGKSRTKVKGTFSNGYQLTRSRTKSGTGNYVITDPQGKEKELKNFSHDFPVEILNIHQTPKVDLFNNGPEDLAFSNQLDKHFLITSTGGNVATAIGNLAHTQPIDQAIKEVKREITNQNSKVISIEKRIKEEIDKLEEFKIIYALEKNINILNEMLNEQEKIQGKIQEIKKITDEITFLNNEIEICNNELLKIPNIKLIEEKNKEHEIKFRKLNELIKIEAEYIDTIDSIKKYSNILKEIPNIKNINEQISKSEAMHSELKKLNNYEEEIKKYSEEIFSYENILKEIPDMNIIEKQLEQQKNNIKKITKNSDVINKLNNVEEEIKILKQKKAKIPNIKIIEKAIKTNEEYSSMYQTNIKIIKEYEEMNHFIDEYGKKANILKERITKGNIKVNEIIELRDNIIKKHSVCPLCGTKNLSKENIENVLKRG